MSSFECFLTVASLTAIGMVFYLPRCVVFGPLIFAWVGGAIGVSVAITCHYERASNRVHLEDSFPLFGAGVICGMLPGFVSMALYCRLSKWRGVIEVLAVTLLFGGVGATFGSYSARCSESKPPVELFWGIGGGLLLGFVVGLIQWYGDGRKRVPLDVEVVSELPSSQLN